MRFFLIRLISMIMLGLMVAVPSGVTAQDATPTGSEAPQGGDVGAAVEWLRAQQLDNGAFAGFDGEANAGTTVDAVIALVAAGNAGVDTGDSVDRAIEYLASDDVASAYQENGVGQAAKLVLALVAADEDPTDFAGINPLETVENGQDPETGIYGTGVYDHAYALLAFAATDTEVPESAITALESTQTESGGWAFDGSTEDMAEDSNTTSMVIQALVATGNGDHAMVQRALEYILTTLDDEGGAGYSRGAEMDANSTALVAQAYIATQGDASTLLGSLQRFQLPSGAYFYQYEDPIENLFATLQAIPAAAGVAYPVMPGTATTPAASPVVWMAARAA